MTQKLDIDNKNLLGGFLPYYSQILPCGQPIITDTRYLKTKSSPQECLFSHRFLGTGLCLFTLLAPFP